MSPFQILPAEPKFFDWFDKMAGTILEAATLLANLTVRFENVASVVANITELEHRGDFIVHETMDLLNKTFVLPIDREDITALIHGLDDTLDNIEAAADALLLYKVTKPTPAAVQLAELILQCARELYGAMPNLRAKKTLPEARRRAIEINRLENEADRVARMGIALLIEAPDQVFEVIRWKAIYDIMEDATDRCEDVADVLQTVVMKQA